MGTNDMCNETMSAKNFSLAKTDQTRLRNATTFVEEERKGRAQNESGNLARKFDEVKSGGPAHHDRSVLSNGDALAQTVHDHNNDLMMQSLVLPGRKPRGHAQLQALAELR